MPSILASCKLQRLQKKKKKMRSVLSLCHALFRETGGFGRALAEGEIQSVAVQIGQRIGAEEALLLLQDLLGRYGLTVGQQATLLPGMLFDLIGYRGGEPKVVVECKQGVIQANQPDHVLVFQQRMREVRKTYPDVIGCIIIDTTIDEDLRAVRGSYPQVNLLWFDLNQRDAISTIAAALDTLLDVKWR